VTVEVTSSDKIESIGSQSETKSVIIDQAKKLEQIHNFMEIRKIGAKIKKTIIPNIYDHDAYHTKMISSLEYVK